MSRRIHATTVCEHCLASFGRRRFPGGRLELMSQFSKRRFCSHQCAVTKLGLDRRVSFWDRIDKSAGADACWPWTGAINSNGYGSYWNGSTVLTSSRHAYELVNGPISGGEGYHGKVVMHRCDNRACCNPSHLTLGTQRENSADRDAKGRGWWQQRSAA